MKFIKINFETKNFVIIMIYVNVALIFVNIVIKTFPLFLNF